MYIIVFEDDLTFNFYPLTLTRPVFELISGTKTLLDSILEIIKPDYHALLVSEYLKPITQSKHPDIEINPQKIDEDVIFINGLLRLNEIQLDKILPKKNYFTIYSGNHVAIAKVNSKVASEALIPPGSMAKNFLKQFKGYYQETEISKKSLIRYPWELITNNHETISNQLSIFKNKKGVFDDKRITFLGSKSNIIVEDDVEIEGNIFLDVRKGPIYLGNKSKILPFSRITGPTYIGKNSIISSANVGSGTTIGDFVKIGGEVKRSIFSGYSNKSHQGYIGDSYVGEWTNIGAMTTNSNIKNTYGNVKVKVQEKIVDSGEIKVGNFIGDNVKMSIGTYLYTGKKIGVASHLHGYIFEDVTNFTIYAKSLGCRLFEVKIDSAIESQKRMMKSRKIDQNKNDVELLKYIFQTTQEERYRGGVLKGIFTF